MKRSLTTAFSVAAGKKKNIMTGCLADADWKAHCIIFSVADEAHTYLTHIHLHYSYAKPTYSDDEATTLDAMASDRRSPIYEALCYLSSLSMGESSRLILIWRFRGCDDAVTWFRQYPEDVRLLRQAVDQSATSIQRRQRENYATDSATLLTIGDPAYSDVVRRQRVTPIVQRGLAGRLGDTYAGRYFNSILSKSVDTDAPGAETTLVDLAVFHAPAFHKVSYAATNGVAEVEKEHSKHRQTAKSNGKVVSFAKLAAESVNRQGEELTVKADTAISTTLAVLDGAPGAGDRPARPTSAAMCHYKDWLIEQHMDDPHFSPFQKAPWAKWREAWAAAGESRRFYYAENAAASSDVFKSWKHLQAIQDTVFFWIFGRASMGQRFIDAVVRLMIVRNTRSVCCPLASASPHHIPRPCNFAGLRCIFAG